MGRMTADLEGAAAAKARLIVLGKPIPGVRERLPAGLCRCSTSPGSGPDRRDIGPKGSGRPEDRPPQGTDRPRAYRGVHCRWYSAVAFGFVPVPPSVWSFVRSTMSK